MPDDLHRPIPRYTQQPLPAYRYRPAQSPHPRRDPRGHSYGKPEPMASLWTPEQWSTLEAWLHAVDLFNEGYWWECHEQLEALWIAAGKRSAHARFMRGVIQIAAGCLHRASGKEVSASKKAREGLATITEALGSGTGSYMGVDLDRWTKAVRKWIEEPGGPALRIELAMS